MPRITRNRPMPSESEPAQSDPQSCIPAPLSVRIPVAVKMTGIGRSKLYELIQEGAIDIVKIGSSTLIPVASLEKLLERNRRC
ncbi:helix-turn-helix domain-containing protein [Sphingobium sp. B2]|uniref:helix-turn-helix domain-containing protein n=1 Tax=Sphingobium sp. B2 TaxID=2583228 RepID=UPI0028F3FB7E|nr:helix-turn-helix domain-containing protein [Sphingobium sp. B2]